MKRLLIENENEIAKLYMEEARKMALNSTCLRSKCGSVIVADNIIIGRGYNSPPMDNILHVCRKDSLPMDFKSDKTCCIHAEQRAIINALRNYSNKINEGRLYFIRLNENNEISYAGKPYCTICSKMALDVGLKEFVLWHEEGITVYDTEYYNELSFQYRR